MTSLAPPPAADKAIRPGPCTLFQNPVEHSSVVVKPAIQLSTSEALVVYTDCRAVHRAGAAPAAARAETPAALLAAADGAEKAAAQGSISRRVLYGPALFVPHADEWVHEFAWSDPSQDSEGSAVAATEGQVRPQAPKTGAGKFSKLQLNSTALHYTVKGVRAADEARLDVRLAVSCQLVDVNQMLDSSCDPIQDLLQALTADVFKFGGKYSLDVLLEKSAALSELENFPGLKTRAEQVGFCVSNIVYRGYKTTNTLEKMLNDTITSRHQQRLEQEHLAAEQQLQTLRLESEVALSEQQNERERQKQALALALQAEQDKFDAAKVAEAHQQRLGHEAREHDQHMRLSQKQDEATLVALQKMKDLGVDLNRYLESLALSQAGMSSSSSASKGGSEALRLARGAALGSATYAPAPSPDLA